MPIEAPTLASIEWPLVDNYTLVAFKRRIEVDVHAAMKCTYGSHKDTISWFVPLHLFVYIYHSAKVHQIPTMCISKGDGALNSFLAERWETKVVQHQGDTIKCSVIGEKIISRYCIAKHTLSMVFSYTRWKLTSNIWEALDSDIVCREQVELQVCVYARFVSFYFKKTISYIFKQVFSLINQQTTGSHKVFEFMFCHSFQVYPCCILTRFLFHPLPFMGISMGAMRVLGYNIHGHGIQDIIPLLSPPCELET